ncbi:hypothetical protein Tco_1306520, partial [Tanacetum coccineum]
DYSKEAMDQRRLSDRKWLDELRREIRGAAMSD